MTQQEINDTVIDVIYDDTQIYHVLEPNQDGVRGVPPVQFLIRNTIATVKDVLQNLDQTKIIEFEDNLKNQ